MTSVFWDFRDNYIAKAQANKELPKTTARPGSFALFPPRAPSQPPITTTKVPPTTIAQDQAPPPPKSSPGPWITTGPKRRSGNQRTGNQRRTFAQAASDSTTPSAPIITHAKPRDHHPPFPLTTIICENRLHKQVYNCFSRLTLLVIAVYIKQQYTFLSQFSSIALSPSLSPHPPAPGPPPSHMDSYIPNVAELPVPIPYGELTYSAIEDTPNPHPITVTNPLQIHEFPETPQGAVAFQALTRVQEFLSHGFRNPDDITPSRSLWLGVVSQLLIAIHNSIRRTHNADPLPHFFSSLSSLENVDFQLLATTSSALQAFFTDRQDDDTPPDLNEICLRCLEECQVPISKVKWESVLLSCGQNIKAAHHTIINTKLREVTEEMDTWVNNARAHIKDAFINSVVNDDIPNFHNEHANDARLVEWAARMKAAVRQTVLAYITNDTILDIVDPWASEALEGAKAHTIEENKTFLVNYTRDQRTIAEASAISDANDFYNSTLATLKAEALERAEREVASYKSDLKIQAEERKEALRLDSIKRIKEPVSSSVTRTNRPKQRADPTARPSRSQSISRSRAPSPESQIVIPISIPTRSPDQTTPRASPVVELSLNRVLTEPALSLQPPPTNVTVGPPENSFEVAMCEASTEPPPIAKPNPSSVPESSFDPSTSGILSAIQGMITEAIWPLASQISVVSARCDTIQSQQAVAPADKPYSPSVPTALWAPNPSHWDRPEISQQNSLPSYLDQPKLDYDADMGDYNYTPQIHPDLLPVADDIEHFYRRLYNVHPDSTLTPSQDAELCQFEDDIEHYHMEWLSSDSGPLPWSDRVEYNFKQWRATILQNRAFQAEDARAKGATSAAQVTFVAADPQPAGSIKLFPDRPPSAPPIATLNNPPTHQPSTNFGWSIIGKSGKPKSFAAVTAQKAKPAAPMATVAPTTTSTRPFLTRKQLTALSHSEVINAIEIRFRTKVISRTSGKDALINRYLNLAANDPYAGQVVPVGQADAYVAQRDQAQAQAQTQSRPRQPRPTPVVTTKYTIMRSPSARTLQKPKGDPAAIVRSLQTAIRQAFGNNTPPISLLSGRWSS